jgi:hypothetical protein
MGFFDFLGDNPRYADSSLALNRLNQRHRFIVEAYADEIAGARVLDLACHDGRWSYALAAAGESFDVVAIYGLYYHVMDHYRLLQLAAGLSPPLIVIDSVFLNRPQPLIRLAVEATDDKFNAIAQRDGQALAPFGIPSPSAVDLMASSLGYTTTWADWSSLPRGRRGGLKEYFDRDRPKYRATVALRPIP